MKSNGLRLGSGWMVVAALCFSLMGALVKLASVRFGFVELVFYRTAFAVLVLAALALWRGQSLYTAHWQAHFWRGLAGTMGLLLFFYAITRLPLATAVTLNYTSPMFLAVLSWLFLKERIAPRVVLGLLVGFVGVVLLLRPTIAAGQWWAGVVGLAAGAFAGWAYLQVRQLAQLGEPEWRVVFYFSLVAMLVTGALNSFFVGWQRIGVQDGWWLLGIGITALLAQLCMTRAYKVGRKFVVASLSYLTVVFSSLAGVLWLSDVVHWQEVLGMAVIVGSGLISSLTTASTKKGNK